LLKDNTLTENHIIEHLRSNITLGHYGEIVYAKEIKDSIEFIITSKQSIQNLKIANNIPHATAMRKALKNETGFTKAIDYNGIEVFAAYTFVEKLGWGIVAKIPTTEINNPYYKAIGIVFILAFLLISISTFILVKITNPIIDTLRKDEKELIAAKENTEEINIKLQSIIQNFPNGSITLLDKNQIIQITGGTEYQKYNLDYHAFINKHITQLLSPKTYEINKPYILQAFEGKSSNYIVEFNGFYYMNYLFPILNNHKETEFVLLMSNNITELKKTEQELIKAKEQAEESEQMFANMTKNVPCVVYQLRVKSDGSTYFNYISEKASELFEFSVDANNAQWNLAAQIPDEDKEAFMNSVIKSITEKIPWHYEGKIVTGSGRIKWFRGKSSPMMIGNEIVFNGIMEDISERKISEQELIAAKEKVEESEEKYRSLSENSTSLIYRILLKPTMRFDYVSPSATIITGFTPEEHYNDPFLGFKMVHPDDKIILENSIKSENTEPIVFRWIRKDGKTIWTEQQNKLIFDEDNEPCRIEGTARDITEAKLAEIQLKAAKEKAEESEARFKNMFEHHNAAMLLIEPISGSIINANEAALKFYGYTKSVLCSMTINEINTLSPEQIQIERNNAINENRNHFIFSHKLATGEMRTVEVHSSPIDFQNNLILFSVIHDITERQKAEQALKESEEKLIESNEFNRNLIDTMQDGFSIVDVQGVQTDSNPAFCKMVGFTIEELRGATAPFPYWPPEEYENIGKAFQQTMQQEGNTFELIFMKKTGERFPVNVSPSPIRNKQGAIISYGAVVEDITERKKAEIQLQNYSLELKKLNTDKDLFIKILAHDLKSPFNSILGFSDLLIKNMDKYDKEKIQTQLKIINQTVRKTYYLLEDILQWTNSQSGKLPFIPQLIKLDEFCNEQIEHIKSHADTKQITVNYFEEVNIQVYADVNMLKTILRNLMLNAVKFTNSSGQISVYAEKNDTYAIITISDTGIGISEKNIAKLWNVTERYTTAGTSGETGTGFGLLLCKEFVEKHGGQIWVESELGKGSNFKFTVPLSND